MIATMAKPTLSQRVLSSKRAAVAPGPRTSVVMRFQPIENKRPASAVDKDQLDQATHKGKDTDTKLSAEEIDSVSGMCAMQLLGPTWVWVHTGASTVQVCASYAFCWLSDCNALYFSPNQGMTWCVHFAATMHGQHMTASQSLTSPFHPPPFTSTPPPPPPHSCASRSPVRRSTILAPRSAPRLLKCVQTWVMLLTCGRCRPSTDLHQRQSTVSPLSERTVRLQCTHS